MEFKSLHMSMIKTGLDLGVLPFFVIQVNSPVLSAALKLVSVQPLCALIATTGFTRSD